MFINLNVAEFRSLVPGDHIFTHINDFEETAVLNYAFYNNDAEEPGWEIETEAGFIALDSAYREFVINNQDNLRRMTRNEFSSLRYGNPLVVLVNGEYVLTIARSDAYPSNSLENIMGYEDTDWEIETDIGFVHNSSAYIEVCNENISC